MENLTVEVFKSKQGYDNYKFDGQLTDEIKDYLKINGYLWSRGYQCYYPATAEAKAHNKDFTEQLKADFFSENNGISESTRINKEMLNTTGTLLETMIQDLLQQVKLQNEKIAELEKKLNEKSEREEKQAAAKAQEVSSQDYPVYQIKTDEHGNYENVEKQEAIPELKTYHTLRKDEVENLEIVSDEEFSDIVDSIILNDYKNIPNVVRLPNLNEQLAEKLGLEKDSALILKKNATHIRPDRKGSYNQALSTEEYYSIPKVIREATFALVDKRTQNFQIIFNDNNDLTKINKLIFNKDELGNYLVTVGKVGRHNSISEQNNIVVAVGVAPTISELRFPEVQPATRLRPSTTTDKETISQKENLSNDTETVSGFHYPEDLEKLENGQIEISENDREQLLSTLSPLEMSEKLKMQLVIQQKFENETDRVKNFIITPENDEQGDIEPEDFAALLNNKKAAEDVSISTEQADVMMKYLRYSDYAVYTDAEDNFHIVDFSEDFSGEAGKKLSTRDVLENVFDLLEHGDGTYEEQKDREILTELKEEQSYTELVRNFERRVEEHNNGVEQARDEAESREVNGSGQKWQEALEKGYETVEKETNQKIATNYVLEKLKTAGIEVITDKEEFDRILKCEEILQKMSLEGSTPLSHNSNGKAAVAISDVNDNSNISQNADKSTLQTMVNKGETYGFAFEGKIYLNPEIMNSNVAVHEYTHLWDEYTKRTNPELWNKGKNILKKTYLWDEIKNSPDYADIADNEDLLTSEVHSRICGEIAQSVLERIAKENGKITKDAVIDWDREVQNYIEENFRGERYLSDGTRLETKGYGVFGSVVVVNDIRSWFSQPMKDLMNGRDISVENKINPTEKSAAVENSDISYFVKSTAEFDTFADFEPVTGLTAEEAVKKYAELQQRNVNCGIGINIKGDGIFDDPDANGVTVLVRNNGKDTFNIYGDTFVKQLKENNEHSQNVLTAFEELDSAARKAGLDVEDDSYIAEKKNELFGNKQSVSYSEESIDITPEEIEKVVNAELDQIERSGKDKKLEEAAVSNVEKSEIEITEADLAAFKAVAPRSQYISTLQYMNESEESNFFKGKVKEIAEAVRNAPAMGETDGLKEHPVVLHYFHPSGTDILVTEIGKNGEAFGWQVLNGDYEMAEFGEIDIEGVKDINFMELDYHIPEGMSVERFLYEAAPEEYSQYAEFAKSDRTEKQENSESENKVPKILNSTDDIEKAIPADYAIPFSMEKREFATAMWYIKDATEENKNIGFYGGVWQSNIEEIASREGISEQDVVDTFWNDYQEINKNAYLLDTVPNPWFARLSDEEKVYVLSDMRTNPDFIGEYQDELNEKGIKFNPNDRPPKEWLLARINRTNYDGEYSYFNENDAGQKRHYEKVISETKLYEDEKFESNSTDDTVLQSFTEIGTAMQNNSALIIKSPVFGDVTFSSGSFGDLSKKNNGGYGINHIVEGRYTKDNLSQEDIASLLYLVKDTVETTSVEIDDTKTRQNIVKNGIWVTLRKDFDGVKQNWIVTGFAENDQNGEMTREAADAIKAVNAQYSYAPEHLFVSEQVGAVIASVQTIAQNILKSNDLERIESFKNVYRETEFLENMEKELLNDNLSQLMSRGKSEQSLESVPKSERSEKSVSQDETLSSGEKNTHFDIYSEEFISKFGDWEKANRIEKLKESDVIYSDGKIIIDGEDYTDRAVEARKNKDLQTLKTLAKQIGSNQKGIFTNKDKNIDIQLSMRNISEISSHHLVQDGHLEAMTKIDEIIKNAIWIDDLKNEDRATNPKIEKYSYFVSGLNINGSDYTVKSVIGTDKDGNHYYDQRLSEIEKGKLTEILTQRMSRENSEVSLAKQYDKRLIQICQVPQMPYLEMRYGEWQPTVETAKRVMDGTLFVEKDENGVQILHDTENGIVIGQELSDFFKKNTENAQAEAKAYWNLKEERKDDKEVNFYLGSFFFPDSGYEIKPAIKNNLPEVELFRANESLYKIWSTKEGFTLDKGAAFTSSEDKENIEFAGNLFKKLQEIKKLEGFSKESLAKADFLVEEAAVQSEEEKTEPTRVGSKTKSEIKNIREQCREILKKPDNEITQEDKAILAQYEGAGGIKEDNRTENGILNEFYTPNNLVEKVWELVDVYAPNAVTVLEPSAGIGRFAEHRDNQFTMHEIDATSARINRILHPDAKIIEGAYQEQFFDENKRALNPDFVQPKYDIVIGNPPYGKNDNEWAGKGEGKEFDRAEEYFISKGLDALKDENSILAFVVPSGFLNSANDSQKKLIGSKGTLIDAYRLPEGTFGTTDVGTDILLMKKWNTELIPTKELFEELQRDEAERLSNGNWFSVGEESEKILGKTVEYTDRWGKTATKVVCNDGLTVQDELNKIDDFVSEIRKRTAKYVNDKKISEQSTIARVQSPVEVLQSDKTNVITETALVNDESAEDRKSQIERELRETENLKLELNVVGTHDTIFLWRDIVLSPTETTAVKLGEVYPDDNGSVKIVASAGDFNNWSDTKEKLKEYFSIVEAEKNLDNVADYSEEKAEVITETTDVINESAAQSEEKKTEPTRVGRKSKAKSSGETFEKSAGKVMSSEEFSRYYGKGYDKNEVEVWHNTDWQGIIDPSKLNAEQENFIRQSKDYVEVKTGEYMHKVIFASGDIYKKLDAQDYLIQTASNDYERELYTKNKELLMSAKKKEIALSDIHIPLKSTLAEEYTVERFNSEGEGEKLNLQEAFILWAKNETLDHRNWRWAQVDYATANISRDDFPENVWWGDIVKYIDGEIIKAEKTRGGWGKTDEELEELKEQREAEANEKRQARKDTADKLFDRFIHNGLSKEEETAFTYEYNKRFNSFVAPDYSKLPLYIDGMSSYKGASPFKLYQQQIKGASFLCNKGNGLLAYDVGVGKTATGIVATMNQIQSGRAKRPLVIVPKAVYTKWVNDFRQLFPDVQINSLGNLSDDFVQPYLDKSNPHSLNIPEGSVSVITETDASLGKITFTDESINGTLFDDFANLLSVDFEDSDRENAANSSKIKAVIGAASQVNKQNYYFFENCGWDNLTVDEAHRFKNLWVKPTAKDKRQSNEFAGIPSSNKPSKKALKLFAMTQLVQAKNNGSNVFLLTATPFTNSPLEVYSMLSYIARERLHEAGIPKLRDFLNEFAQTKFEMSVGSDNRITHKQVMKSWKSLPALQSILREYIDKVDADEVKGLVRPYKVQHKVALEMTPLQKRLRQADEEFMSTAKAGNLGATLVAMTNMRINTIAPALANPAYYPNIELPPRNQMVETSPKLKFVCDTVADMYNNGNQDKGQFIYLPLGKEAHGYIKSYLVEKKGIPADAIEIINGDINNQQEKKDAITKKFNDPKEKVKILIGGMNTSEGIDLNGNSFVMYNCSLGWNPSETVQAEGRIHRQGNLQGVVHTVYPLINDSIDSVLFEKHSQKKARIDQLFKAEGSEVEVEDTIDPEKLKIELIKDPIKRAELIESEATKEMNVQLSKINLKISSFEEIAEENIRLTDKVERCKEDIKSAEDREKDFLVRGLEVPEYVKYNTKCEKEELRKTNARLQRTEEKLASLNLKTKEERDFYLHNLNEQKHELEDRIENFRKVELPKLLKELEEKRLEEQVTAIPLEKQSKILQADILGNLRPMEEVKEEVMTNQHVEMLNEMLKEGTISQEEFDVYKAAGWKKYDEFLAGDITFAELKGEKPQVLESPVEQQQEQKTENTVSSAREVAGESTVETAETKAVDDDLSNIAGGLWSKDEKANDNGSGLLKEEKGELLEIFDNPFRFRFNEGKIDPELTSEQLSQSIEERNKIVFPIINGIPTGMYKAFNDFADGDVFDIVGKSIDMDGDYMTVAGVKQLQAAMEIYRNKNFETFRYVMIDRKSGEIADQLAVSSCIPNKSSIDDEVNSVLQSVIHQAYVNDYAVVIAHNHPSGFVAPSGQDRDTTKVIEKALTENNIDFAGHIILDHETFSFYDPKDKQWSIITNIDKTFTPDRLVKDDFVFKYDSINNSADLSKVAQKINDKNNWSDDFVPVVFTSTDKKVTGVKLFSKFFFDFDPEFIRNRMQFNGLEAGATNAYPVITESFAKSLSSKERKAFEEKFENLLKRNSFTDVALPKGKTLADEKRLETGEEFYWQDSGVKTIQSTFVRKVENYELSNKTASEYDRDFVKNLEQRKKAAGVTR